MVNSKTKNIVDKTDMKNENELHFPVKKLKTGVNPQFSSVILLLNFITENSAIKVPKTAHKTNAINCFLLL